MAALLVVPLLTMRYGIAVRDAVAIEEVARVLHGQAGAAASGDRRGRECACVDALLALFWQVWRRLQPVPGR